MTETTSQPTTRVISAAAELLILRFSLSMFALVAVEVVGRHVSRITCKAMNELLR